MTSQERVTTQRRRRRPTQSGAVLSEELIVRTAMRLIEEHGAEGLSVRRLGTALGADPTAIYRYFHGTDDLMQAIVDQLIADGLAGYVPDPDWQVALREFGQRVYSFSQLHPRLAMVSASRVSLRKNEIRAVEMGIGLLRRAGFPPEAAVRNYHAFIDFVLGFAALDASGGDANRPQEWTAVYTSLPEDEFPVLAEVRDHIHTMAGSAFQTALNLLLKALAAEAPNGQDR